MGTTRVNAVVGAAVTLVTSPVVPFAPVLGGGVAGYLEAADRPDRDQGLRVGAVSGILAFLALLLFAVLAANLLFAVFTGVVGVPPGFVSGLGVFVFFVGAFFGAVYVVGLSALGGWLGVYVRQEV